MGKPTLINTATCGTLRVIVMHRMTRKDFFLKRPFSP